MSVHKNFFPTFFSSQTFHRISHWAQQTNYLFSDIVCVCVHSCVHCTHKSDRLSVYTHYHYFIAKQRVSSECDGLGMSAKGGNSFPPGTFRNCGERWAKLKNYPQLVIVLRPNKKPSSGYNCGWHFRGGEKNVAFWRYSKLVLEFWRRQMLAVHPKRGKGKLIFRKQFLPRFFWLNARRELFINFNEPWLNGPISNLQDQ